MAIQGGRIQKANKKSLNAKGKGKGKGKGKDKSYIPKPKNPKPSAKEHPALSQRVSFTFYGLLMAYVHYTMRITTIEI
ncbi:hypothetical protein Tco_0037519, partial [Tanacetum coccineum]